jgi:hypothetical protein
MLAPAAFEGDICFDRPLDHGDMCAPSEVRLDCIALLAMIYSTMVGMRGDGPCRSKACSRSVTRVRRGTSRRHRGEPCNVIWVEQRSRPMATQTSEILPGTPT